MKKIWERFAKVFGHRQAIGDGPVYLRGLSKSWFLFKGFFKVFRVLKPVEFLGLWCFWSLGFMKWSLEYWSQDNYSFEGSLYLKPNMDIFYYQLCVFLSSSKHGFHTIGMICGILFDIGPIQLSVLFSNSFVLVLKWWSSIGIYSHDIQNMKVGNS
jgi:hypothetical protein